jgi:hypothetical protein
MSARMLAAYGSKVGAPAELAVTIEATLRRGARANRTRAR